MITKSIQSALTVSLGVAAFAGTIPVVHAQGQAAGLEEVFVTARKRDEGVQAVPIAMVALSNEVLEQRGVREVQDLNLAVPGFRFGVQGGKGNSEATLRGLSKIPIGDGVPSVVTYFANVALPGRGGNIPTYDMANIQVLKGPQGTLFGRNTLGGAIVMAPVAPTYEMNGYVRGAYGIDDLRVGEGAINLPIVDDKVALRIGGQVRRQDGLNKNLSGGPDFDNTHQNSYRVSLLLNPTDNIENLTVYDHMSAKEQAAMGYIFRLNPSLAGLEAGFNNAIPGLGIGTQIGDQLRTQLARSQAAGYHEGFTDLPDGGSVDRTLWGVSNDTTFDMGWATFRNIFGYRDVKVAEAIASGANDPIFVTGLAPFPLPFTLFDASQKLQREVISDEMQLFGTAMDDRLEWITGYYFSKDEPTGQNGTIFTAFSLGGVPSTPVSAFSTYYNWAVFAQTGFDLSDWVADGLKLNTGIRYSKDKQSVCAGPDTDIMTPNECETRAQDPANLGVGTAKVNGDEFSWTIGLDWQITPDTLLYVTHRRGYRAGVINTPVFNTYYTTGGNGPIDPAFGAQCDSPVLPNDGTDPFICPDLRDFQSTEPEEINDIEIGVKNDFYLGDVKGRINLAYYYMTYDNAVQFLNTQVAGIPSGYDPSSGSVGYNAANLIIQGVEADLTVIPVPSLTLTLSGAYTDQKIDEMVAPGSTGSPLVITPGEENVVLPSPKVSASFGFNWVLPVNLLDGDIALNGDYYYTDDFGGQNGENLPGYELTNFRLAWSGIAKTGLDVAAYVKNAFDEEYFSSPVVLLPSFPVSVAIPGEKRTWGVEATYKF